MSLIAPVSSKLFETELSLQQASRRLPFQVKQVLKNGSLHLSLNRDTLDLSVAIDASVGRKAADNRNIIRIFNSPGSVIYQRLGFR